MSIVRGVAIIFPCIEKPPGNSYRKVAVQNDNSPRVFRDLAGLNLKIAAGPAARPNTVVYEDAISGARGTLAVAHKHVFAV
jgi:hypothetical protein